MQRGLFMMESMLYPVKRIRMYSQASQNKFQPLEKSSSNTRNNSVLIQCGKNKDHYLKYDSALERMIATEHDATIFVVKDPGVHAQTHVGQGFTKVYIGDACAESDADGNVNAIGHYYVKNDGEDKYVAFSGREFDATKIDNSVFIQRVYKNNNQDFRLSWIENPGEDNEQEHFVKFNEDDLSIQVEASEDDEDSRFRMILA